MEQNDKLEIINLSPYSLVRIQIYPPQKILIFFILSKSNYVFSLDNMIGVDFNGLTLII